MAYVARSLTWSYTPVVAEGGLHGRPPTTRTGIVALKDGGTFRSCAPEATIKAQSFQRSTRFWDSRMFECNRTHWVVAAFADGTVVALVP